MRQESYTQAVASLHQRVPECETMARPPRDHKIRRYYVRENKDPQTLRVILYTTPQHLSSLALAVTLPGEGVKSSDAPQGTSRVGWVG
jgi:hypothetical protein